MTHDAASVAEAESFAARLESLAASIPPARPLDAPLAASVPSRDGTTAAHRAAVAFERLVGGEDAPRTTWYSAGKRHLHQPQLEALAGLVAPMAESSGDPRDERVVLELGAGQALLGRLVSRITSAPLVAVDRRDTGDAPRTSHDDDREDAGRDEMAPPGEKDDAPVPAPSLAPALAPALAPESDATPDPKMTRVVVDLTRCAYDDLLADANLAPRHLTNADAPPSAVVVAKHLCAGAADAAVRLVVDGAARRPGRAAVASVALAPCCHPQIRHEEYSGAEWLERAWRDAGNRIGAGSPSSSLGPAGFARVLALIGVSKERAGASTETLVRYHGKSLGALTEIRGGFARLRRLGRVARRALEFGRAEALRAGGFPDARVCRYVDAATSPDNLVIVAGTPADASGADSSGADSSGADPDATVDGVPARGVVAHVNAADAGARGSLSRRVAEYLLESRGRSLRAGEPPPMESVAATSAWRPAGEATAREKKQRQKQKQNQRAGDARRPAKRSKRRDDDGHPGDDELELDDGLAEDETARTSDPAAATLGESTRVPAVMVGGDPSRILAFLASRGRAHVARSVGMLCPFDRHERARPGETADATLARIADRVVRLARGGDDRGGDGDGVGYKNDRGGMRIGDVVVRLAAFPRSLEDALSRALDGRVPLSPSTFTHSLCATRWIPDGDDDDPPEGGYLWSFLPVEDWDPRDWRARAAAAGSADAGTRATRAAETSMGEIAERLRPSAFAPAPARALVVTDDGPAMESALARWCADVAGASRVVVSRPRRGEDGGWSAVIVGETARDDAPPPGPADVCVFRLGRELEDAVDALAAATRRETREGQGPALRPGAWIVGPGVKLGRRARRRRAAEEAAKTLRGAGFVAPRVLHMLADRELERTVACRLGDGDAGGDAGRARREAGRARREGGARADSDSDSDSSGERTRV